MRLLDGARPVDVIESDLQTSIETTIGNLRGRQVNVPGRWSHRYPQAPDLLSSIRHVLESSTPTVQDNVRVPALRELLFRPERVYPEKTRGIDEKAVTFIGAFQDPDREDPLVAAIRLRLGEAIRADVTFADAEGGVDVLEAVYLRTELSARTVLPGPKKAPKLAWLGGSAGEGATPPDWRERVEASAAVRGFTAQVFEQPYRRFDLVRREVHDGAAAVGVVWVPYSVNQTGWSGIPAGGGGVLQMLETPESSFEDALLDSMMQLDDWVATQQGPTDQAAADVPTSAEIRIYKKHYATAGRDVMVRANDCGHDSWEPARKAPKAERGVAKAEPEGEIAALEKCMRCTGGGRWRVTFA